MYIYILLIVFLGLHDIFYLRLLVSNHTFYLGVSKRSVSHIIDQKNETNNLPTETERPKYYNGQKNQPSVSVSFIGRKTKN